MMDLHDALNVDTSKHGDLYEDAEGGLFGGLGWWSCHCCDRALGKLQ